MRRFDAVLFDLDGTLLYTLPDIRLALNHALSAYGYPPRTAEEVRSFVGNGVRRLVQRALPPGAADGDAVYEAYEAYYLLHGQDHVTVYPGVRELLTELGRRGVAVGVVTNKTHPSAAAMIEAFFGDLAAVTEGKKEGRPVKPSPESLWDAMTALGVSRERALYVGDSGVDAETAKNAGLPCVLVSWGYRDRAELSGCQALGVVDEAAELLNYIEVD